MTYREKYLKDHPEKPFNINTMCPWHYYYKDTTDCPAEEITPYCPFCGAKMDCEHILFARV